MPLKYQETEEAFKHNLQVELKSGKSKKQALAVAYAIKDKMRKKRKPEKDHQDEMKRKRKPREKKAKKESKQKLPTM